jgi:xanthine dehydrogenase iron-sulfur cluster and FAD-binding subunit A
MTDHAHQMTNTHILYHEFDYAEPTTVQGAIGCLAGGKGVSVAMAGGTYLLVQMKMEHLAPKLVTNLGRVPGLGDISGEDGKVNIGPLAKIWEIQHSPIICRNYPALVDACASFGSTQVKLMGTIGGNLCNGSPASDSVPALMALGARLLCVGPDGERWLSVEDLMVGPGETALRDGELLTKIELPRSEPGTGSAFVKLSRVAADLAKASVAAVVVRDGDRVESCRLAFGSVGPTVLRAPDAEQLLAGQLFSDELALEAGLLASEAVQPIDDVRSTARYRREVVKALTYDTLQAAWSRSSESGSDAARELSAGEVNGPGRGDLAAQDDLRVAAGQLHPIQLNVNGVRHSMSVAPNELLIHVLRERLELTGAKYGCGIGECGACTVLLNGEPALSCLVLAVSIDGAEVLTVEGLESPEGELHPIQRAFIEQNAFQCGYCTPGMLVMTKSLLERYGAPTEEQIRDYLKGNRCRCTGFASIVRAINQCSRDRD